MSSYKLGKMDPRSLSIFNIFDWLAPLNANTKASSYKINTALAQIPQPKTSDVLQKMMLQLQCGPVKIVKYRQMGELRTLFEFACSLYLTCNMVLDMDGSIIMYYDIFYIKIVWHKI